VNRISHFARSVAGTLAVSIPLLVGLPIDPVAADCFWDGTNPICSGSCPSGYNVVEVKACTLHGFKVKCCEQTHFISQPDVSATKKAAKLCPSGLVWRERFDGDTVCVSPQERDANRRRRGLPVN
jgi:hypothetical protein